MDYEAEKLFMVQRRGNPAQKAAYSVVISW
jgi:hypothetical protein